MFRVTAVILFVLGAVSESPAETVREHVEQFEDWSARAKNGDAVAQYLLSISYDIGRGVGRDRVAAVHWLRMSAEGGHAPAQVDLAYRYADGNGVTQDAYTSYAWLKIAASIDPNNQKYIDAINGRVSAEFISMGKRRELELRAAMSSNAKIEITKPRLDDAQLFQAIKKLALDGNVNSQARLGQCYALGKGVDQDWDEAVYWWRRAADAGSAGAQFGLAMCYLEGNGVEQSPHKAFVWFLKSANQGDAAAEFNVGMSYATGRGVDRDDRKAVEWLMKSALQGYAEAQLCLAGHYNMGRGLDKDAVEAYAWLCLASLENDMAQQLKKRYSSSMTEEQLELSRTRLNEISAIIESRRKSKSK